jgi:tetratricopeptide (TPR) repeat protein
MRNLPDRHRSLRVVFDQSWQSLTPVEQEILARLSVFHNGCTREAAEQVAGAKPLVFMALVDKALLRHRSNRYDMHELVRQYAAERLSQDPRLQEETLDRHHRYYLEILESANAGYKGGRQLETGLEIVTDIDNIRAAWSRAAQRNDRRALAGAAETYWLYNEFRGTLSQGAAAFREALEAIQTPEDDPVLTGFLCAAEGSLLARQWHLEQGREKMEQGLNLLRKADPADPEKTAFALAWFAFLHVLHGQYPEAVRAAQESLEYYAQTGDRWTQSGALRFLGAAALYQGQLRRAEEYLNQCVAVCKSIGELRIRSYATANLGVIHLWYGQIDEARQYFEDSIRISKTCNDRLSRADALCERGRMFLATGELDRAVETARNSMNLYNDLGRTQMSLANIILGKALMLKDEAGAEQALREGLAAARAVSHKADIATAIEGLGTLALRQREYDQAEQYFRESLAVWTAAGHEPEIATLLCRLGSCMLVAGSTESQKIREYFTRALELGEKHQAGTLVITAMVSLAALQLHDSEGDISRLAALLQYARQNPATPYEVRAWLDGMISNLPKDLPAIPDAGPGSPAWLALTQQWRHALALA